MSHMVCITDELHKCKYYYPYRKCVKLGIECRNKNTARDGHRMNIKFEMRQNVYSRGMHFVILVQTLVFNNIKLI